jgi:hypothetical protein
VGDVDVALDVASASAATALPMLARSPMAPAAKYQSMAAVAPAASEDALTKSE